MGECGMKWLIPSLLSLASTTAAEHNWDYRDINVGSNLYADNCASCHGINLEGQPNWRSQNAKQTQMAVKRVNNLTGGNYWGMATKNGVALSASEIFDRNFSSAFFKDIRASIQDAIDGKIGLFG